MARQLRDFARAPRRSAMEAAGLQRVADDEPAEIRERKAELLGSLRGTIVEIGPGPGVNLRHYAPGVRVVAVEPNPAMHDGLRRAADRHDVDVDLRPVHAEVVDLPDGSADAVVSTLVLCGVDDPAAVVAQVRRVLRPGGTFVVYEHVRAPARSVERLVQRIVKRPHRWLLNGCEVDRDTGALLRDAFDAVDLTRVDAGLSAAYTRTRIIGTATG